MICNNTIDEYHMFDGTKSYLVDANVLLSLYGHSTFSSSQAKHEKIKKAQQYLNKALDSNSQIYVPAIVISEFMNRCLRASFEDYKNSFPQKKNLNYKRDYRGTEQYRKDLDYYSNILKNDVFSKMKYINDSFDCVNVDTFFKFNNDDFNDKLIIHIANKNNLYIISADKDISTLIIN